MLLTRSSLIACERLAWRAVDKVPCSLPELCISIYGIYQHGADANQTVTRSGPVTVSPSGRPRNTYSLCDLTWSLGHKPQSVVQAQSERKTD
jgi:hypothetical protein